MRRITFALFLLAIVAPTVTAADKAPPLAERLDAYVQPFLEDGHLAGTLLVARSGTPLKDLSFLVGAGSEYSTPGDLHRLLQAVVTGQLGEGVKGSLLRSNGLRWNGITNGYRAFADYDGSTEIEVIFAGNLQTGAADLLRRDVPRIVQGDDVATPARLEIEPAKVATEVLRRYTGTYETRPGSTIELTVEDGQLWASGWLLIPTSEATFFSLQDYAEIAVVFDAAGEVERLDWAPPGNTWPCPKVR